MSAAVSEENSFDKVMMAQEVSFKSGNPFSSDRRLTDSVPPKTTRMTLQRDQPQPAAAFEYQNQAAS